MSKSWWIQEQEYWVAYYQATKVLNENPALSMFTQEARNAIAVLVLNSISKERVD